MERFLDKYLELCTVKRLQPARFKINIEIEQFLIITITNAIIYFIWTTLNQLKNFGSFCCFAYLGHYSSVVVHVCDTLSQKTYPRKLQVDSNSLNCNHTAQLRGLGTKYVVYQTFS